MIKNYNYKRKRTHIQTVTQKADKSKKPYYVCYSTREESYSTHRKTEQRKCTFLEDG